MDKKPDNITELSAYMSGINYGYIDLQGNIYTEPDENFFG